MYAVYICYDRSSYIVIYGSYMIYTYDSGGMMVLLWVYMRDGNRRIHIVMMARMYILYMYCIYCV